MGFSWSEANLHGFFMIKDRQNLGSRGDVLLLYFFFQIIKECTTCHPSFKKLKNK
jgi:ABC-type uncharacterized transport system permease subunit